MIDITQIILAVFALIGTVITTCLVPVIKSKLDANKQAELLQWVSIAVNAAEQLCKAGIINKDERKQHVLDFLNSHGFTVDMDKIEAMIESAVYSLPPLEAKDESKKKS